jgi:hypothetical protein
MCQSNWFSILGEPGVAAPDTPSNGKTLLTMITSKQSAAASIRIWEVVFLILSLPRFTLLTGGKSHGDLPSSFNCD